MPRAEHASVPFRRVRAGECRCEEFLYELKAGQRAAACGGRPGPATPRPNVLPPGMLAPTNERLTPVRQLMRSHVLPGNATMTDHTASKQLGAQDGTTGSKRMVSPVIR
jgi:hypothetical protein